MSENELAKTGEGFSLTPQSLKEAMEYAEIIANSDVIPADYKGNPGNVLVAMQMGIELGLPALQALQNIAVINGRPCVWGDSLMAIARAHPECEYISEEFDDNRMVATCRVKRRGEPEQVRSFSMDEAQQAGLNNKGPWKAYPKRMLQMRARGFGVRDVFPDALRGIAPAEEVRDIPPEKEVGPAPETQKQGEPEPLPEYPQDKLDANKDEWAKRIAAGNTDPEQLIAMISTKYALSDEQARQIRALSPESSEEPENADS